MIKPLLLSALVTTLGAGATASLRDQPPPPKDPQFTELCDASAGLFLDDRRFVVANDEDPEQTVLRVYDITAPGAPVGRIDVTAALAPDAADKEVDLEGLTRFGTRFALIGSHSRRGDEGKPAPSRRRLLAFELTGTAPGVGIASPKRYTTLVEDAQAALATQPAPLNALVLDKPLGAKFGGLSIEALAEAPGGKLLIGVRSPLGPGDQALILVLKNAAAVFDSGAKASFGPPILLDLRKQGLRDLVNDGNGGYLLLSGRPGEGGTFALWSWAGPGGAAPRKRASVANDPDTSAEAIVLTPDKKAVWILFDEGERKTASGKRCKSDSVPASGKSFRARRIALGGS